MSVVPPLARSIGGRVRAHEEGPVGEMGPVDDVRVETRRLRPGGGQ